jgi:hypothetical protein
LEIGRRERRDTERSDQHGTHQVDPPQNRRS